MDMTFTPKELAFRAEVKSYLHGELPEDWWFRQGAVDVEMVEIAKGLERKLAKKGWFPLDWPPEYGGGKYSVKEMGLFGEEWGWHRCETPNNIGLIAGRAMLAVGTEDNKKRWLPAIARGGEVIYCEGYTEPDAGSDLASLKTTAVKQGDEWVFNGQKAFNTHGHLADYIWLLARTNPNVRKHQGLSMFVVDMKTPGITVRRQKLLGPTLANDVFFDNVRAPGYSLVGQEGQGWYYFAAKFGPTSTFPLEGYGLNRRFFDNLVGFCREASWNGKPVGKDPVVRDRMADLRVTLECWRLLAWRVYLMRAAGQQLTTEGAALSLLPKEFPVRVSQTGRELLRNYALVRKGSKWAKLAGEFEDMATHQYLLLHPGGTTDIQRNMIAERALGLPKAT